jgi:multidrug efflux pump subunit AcrA (membrane-fusion protein)
VQVKPSPVAPEPSAVLALQGGGVELTAPIDGTVAWHIENGAEVQAGDVVAKLGGFQQAEAALQRATKALAHDQERLAFYTEKQNAAKIAEKQALVDKDKAAIADAEAKLAQLVIKAPQAGTAQLLAGKGAKVTPGSPVVKIGGEPQLTATFNVGDAASQYVPDAACSVAAKGARDKQYACSVVSVENGAVTVRLVSGAQAAEGDEVTLLPAKK